MYTLYIQFVGKPDTSAKVSGAKVRHMCTCTQLDAVLHYNIYLVPLVTRLYAY